MANVWWYAFTVLEPARRLRPFGISPYKSRDIGSLPLPGRGRGLGPKYSLARRGAVLLKAQPADYASVEAFDALSTNYDWVVEPFARPVFEEALELLRPLTTKRSRLLDCSCGPGTEVFKWAELVPNGEVVGSDMAAEMAVTAARHAKERGVRNVAFFQADVAHLPKHFAKQFDLVYSSLAFHHYPDGVAALREMRRALRVGGHAFIVDAGPWWMKAIASPWAKWGDPGWVAFHTGPEFEALFAEAGFNDFYWTEILPGVGLSIGTK